ncbi:flagellar L-ring protein precursor FlgH [Selenomonas ruminantium]|uniref:Flagellar L-ring protein FlgH n=1 Tax=Selenomonas ruminantium TaxID=971 RepID=A0A1M6TBB8_SELRU|nr:flagellar basal body L-ring protein FlgH [Selenomonas ruminantium]SHK54352.1 flagellar L-ring protein precursor FlgH [Selenomonas ruminantium]
MQIQQYHKKIALALAVGGLFLSLAPPAASAQSLWAGGGRYRNIFSDRKAQDVGDILTIAISESTSLSTSKSSSNSKSGNVSLSTGVGIFDFLRAASASGSDSFKANGASSAKNSTTANVTVTVVDIQPNGNLVLEGTQSIWHNKNEHKITFRGICRPEDVTANNIIASTKIANAMVRFDGKGPLNAKQRQGILTQVFNILF